VWGGGSSHPFWPIGGGRPPTDRPNGGGLATPKTFGGGFRPNGGGSATPFAEWGWFGFDHPYLAIFLFLDFFFFVFIFYLTFFKCLNLFPILFNFYYI
jgi:hypothetical protein